MQSGNNPSQEFPPPGWVTREDVCRMFDVSSETLKRWYKDGRLCCGKAVRRAGGGRCKIYPVGELQRLAKRMRRRREDLLEGLVDRHEACRMFGVTLTTWKRWQRAGRVPRGQRIRLPDERSDRRVYRRDELERLVEEFNNLSQPYPDPQRPGCCRVPVMRFWTVVCEAIIDEQSLPLVAGRRWNWQVRGDGYHGAVILADHQVRSVPLHRIVLGLEGTHCRVTHGNGDPLDCRRANLIVRNPSEHSASARKSAAYGGRPCTSRFKGVTWEEKRGKWRVMIQKDGENRYLGRFDDEIAAAEAYDDAARELFGEHARLNFPDGVDAWLEKEGNRSGERAAA